MDSYLSATDHKILELMYYYGFAWPVAIQNFLGLTQGPIQKRLVYLSSAEIGFLHRKLLRGESRRQTYAITEKGFEYLKNTYDFQPQFIDDRDVRFDTLTDGFIRHECLVSLVASTFTAQAGERQVYDRRRYLAHLPTVTKDVRSIEGILPMEIRTREGSHKADDIIYIEEHGQRPTALFVEIDRGTESARDKYGRPRGKVSKMFNFFLDGWREKFYRNYFGRDVRPVVLFVISTPWAGSTRKQNFIDLWREVGGGQAQNLPRFVTLDEFKKGDPFQIISAGEVV